MPHHTHHQPAPATTRGRTIRWAQHYDLLVSVLTLGRRAQLRRDTIALARLQAGERVLEVGCGTGDLTLLAQELVGPGGSALGVDAAPEMVAVARGKAQRAGSAARFEVGVIEALALPAASADVALSSLMMHHLPPDLQRRGLAEIARVLRPGGRLVIVDIDRLRGLRRLLSPVALIHGELRQDTRALAQLAAEAGLTVREVGSLGRGGLGFVRAERGG